MKNAVVGWSSVPGPESALTPAGPDCWKALWSTLCISIAASKIAAVGIWQYFSPFSPSFCDYVPQKLFPTVDLFNEEFLVYKLHFLQY